MSHFIIITSHHLTLPFLLDTISFVQRLANIHTSQSLDKLPQNLNDPQTPPQYCSSSASGKQRGADEGSFGPALRTRNDILMSL